MKPILFNTEMVQAILEGRKMVTRRVVKPSYKSDEGGFQVCTNKATGERWVEKSDWEEGSFDNPRYVNPPYQVGDILYVREPGMIQSMKNFGKKVKILFKADNSLVEFSVSDEEYERLSKWELIKRWLSPYWLTKETARIFLKVTDVRVERLQDITSDQAKNEGVDLNSGTPFPKATARDCHGAKNGLSMYQSKFVILWNSTIKKKDLGQYGWKANPWVWVIEFERMEVKQ